MPTPATHNPDKKEKRALALHPRTWKELEHVAKRNGVTVGEQARTCTILGLNAYRDSTTGKPDNASAPNSDS